MEKLAPPASNEPQTAHVHTAADRSDVSIKLNDSQPPFNSDLSLLPRDVLGGCEQAKQAIEEGWMDSSFGFWIIPDNQSRFSDAQKAPFYDWRAEIGSDFGRVRPAGRVNGLESGVAID